MGTKQAARSCWRCLGHWLFDRAANALIGPNHLPSPASRLSGQSDRPITATQKAARGWLLPALGSCGGSSAMPYFFLKVFLPASLLALLDDIASIPGDVEVLPKVAAKKRPLYWAMTEQSRPSRSRASRPTRRCQWCGRWPRACLSTRRFWFRRHWPSVHSHLRR